MSNTSSTLDVATLEDGRPEQEMDEKPQEIPEGGTRGWLTVAGSSAALFATFGWVNCIGLFQAQYEQVQLRDYSSSTVSWITSIECKSAPDVRFSFAAASRMTTRDPDPG